MSHTILKCKDVLNRTGLSRTTIWRWIKMGVFPEPIKMGRSTGWIESEIDNWVEARMKSRKSHAASETADASLSM